MIVRLKACIAGSMLWSISIIIGLTSCRSFQGEAGGQWAGVQVQYPAPMSSFLYLGGIAATSVLKHNALHSNVPKCSTLHTNVQCNAVQCSAMQKS